jgi:hypothetical protein
MRVQACAHVFCKMPQNAAVYGLSTNLEGVGQFSTPDGHVQLGWHAPSGGVQCKVALRRRITDSISDDRGLALHDDLPRTGQVGAVAQQPEDHVSAMVVQQEAVIDERPAIKEAE